jgi:hypothetical protein
MPDPIPALLALVTVTLFGIALWAMTVGRLTVAGFCFLSASLFIYLRERSLRGAGGS